METGNLKAFNRFYFLVSVMTLAVVVLRCALVPFSHDEVATFYFYVQPGKFLPFLSHPDANGHFLMSATAWMSFKLFGSSPLALRLPCIAAYLVMCYAVFRFNKLFLHNVTRSVFSAAFLISFNFLSFYALCRGYALSMSFLCLAVYYLVAYRRSLLQRHFFKFILFSQIALSANLTLVIVLVILTFLIGVFQIRHRRFFNVQNILMLLFHGALLFFWTKYAFYLKEAGALYYGGGESYWQVTFKSLIDMLTVEATFPSLVVLALFLLMFVFLVRDLIKEGKAVVERDFFLVFPALVLCILAFYLMKVLLGVNYPEDRTGLFFYLLFMVSLAFLIDRFNKRLRVVFVLIPLFFASHFVYAFNLKNHCWRIYETMPVSFFDALIKEQSLSERPLTVGGHRVREFFYGFLNYNSDTKLNHITAPEALQMNCDYALAYRQDEPFYKDYYTVIASEEVWGFRLLKRRSPIKREEIATSGARVFEGDGEYFNFIEIKDTLFSSENPLQAEMSFTAADVPVPLNAWLVLQIDTDAGNNQLVRIPLDLVAHDLRSKPLTLSNITGNVPKRITRLVAYLWNIDKQPIRINIHSFKLYRLHGDGVTLISKAKI